MSKEWLLDRQSFDQSSLRQQVAEKLEERFTGIETRGGGSSKGKTDLTYEPHEDAPPSETDSWEETYGSRIVRQATIVGPRRKRTLGRLKQGRLTQPRQSQVIFAQDQQTGTPKFSPLRGRDNPVSDFPVLNRKEARRITNQEEVKGNVATRKLFTVLKGKTTRTSYVAEPKADHTAKVIKPESSFSSYIGPPDETHPPVKEPDDSFFLKRGS